MVTRSYEEGYHSLAVPEMPNYEHISVKPMTLALGATISGINLSEIHSNKIYSEILVRGKLWLLTKHR